MEDTIQIISNSTETRRGSESTFKTNFQGEADDSITPSSVISQLVKPRCDKAAAFLTGLRLPTVKKRGFRCPDDLCMIVEPMEESNEQVNLTPRYSFVDLHIGRFHNPPTVARADTVKIMEQMVFQAR
jgi:hypothetical protein